MAFNSAASNSFVDLSEENDNTGTVTAVSSNVAETFERSCDNPECSAPKLISLVPKPDASEFITEPMIVHQPTLINGFTTVFQINGVSQRMEDLMNESTANENHTLGENCKPKTVFRVVPNTHAHIVNYVVVDATGETMRKIKANDPETMRKLLVSQRLSAEQMLKKLIGKSLETPTKTQNPCNGPAPPCSSTVPVPNETSPPKVPSGITIKLLSGSESNNTPNLSTSTSAGFSKNQIQIKQAFEAKKSTSASSSRTATESASSNNQTPKSLTPLTQKTNKDPIQTDVAAQTPLRPMAAGGRVIAASKPVVWQAVPPGIASKCTPTPIKTTPPRIVPAISPRKTQPVVISPTRISTSSLNTSASEKPLSKQLNTAEFVDVEKAISATSIAVNRNPIDSPIKQQNLKRKPELNSSVPEAIKRLRPRSPTRVRNPSPLAGNLSEIRESPPVTRKLPTLPKFQKIQVPPKISITGKRCLIGPKPQVKSIVDNVVASSDESSNKEETSKIEVEKSLEPTPPAQSNTPVRRKNKPLMGPASKMKALKDIADAKTKALQNDSSTQCKPALISESSPMKIGETTITRTGSSKSAKESAELTEILTKPCSVAITDIAKSNATTDSDSDSKTKRSGATLRSFSEKGTCNTTNKKQNAYEALVDRYRGRWTIKNEDETVARKQFLRSTRSSTTTKATAKTVKTEGNSKPCDDISDSTLLTTPSAPSRVLRVVLPSTKNGIVNNPSTSPHPNLKISSVISGGTTLAPSAIEVDTETPPIIIKEDNSGPGIEQLQKELADLRRTVARLAQGKNV